MTMVFFGELMLRLTPALPQQQLIVAKQLTVDFAGAESNVASALSRFGHSCQFVTKLPQNLVADHAISSLKQFGIDTTNVLRGGQRIGTYFIEIGASIRPSTVVYDRQYSAISAIGENEFNWHAILSGAKWLHVGGILPALSLQCANETIKAVKIAKDLGVKVSFDLNFRRSLWPEDHQAEQIFSRILTYCDIAFGNAGVIKDVFNYQSNHSNITDIALDLGTFLQHQFNADFAMTHRQHLSASKNKLTSFYFSKNTLSSSSEISVDILDRLGTGDAFAAGVLHGLQHNFSAEKTVNFANACFALSHTCYGDQCWFSVEDVMEIVNGNILGYIRR